MTPKRILIYVRNLVRALLSIVRTGGWLTINVTQVRDSNLLSGKGVLITGGTSGIGQAIARRAVECGAFVVITGRDSCRLAAVCEEIGLERCFGVVWDARNLDEIQGVLSFANEKLPFGINVLINNAGVLGNPDFLSVNSEEWDLCYQTNSKATFFLCQAVISEWLVTTERATKKVINIGSQGGAIGATYPYRLSKWDISGFTHGLALKYSDENIIVNAICPGIVKTRMQGARAFNSENFYDDRVPLGRHASVVEVAELAVFMVSDRCNFLTGQSIVLDGGYTLAKGE